MIRRKIPSQRVLSRLLRYDPVSGKLYWRHRPAWMFRRHPHSGKRVSNAKMWNSRYAGKEAFTADNGQGYLQGSIFGQMHRAHRVIYKMITGEVPDIIDHENGARDDNRFVNLRSVSSSENSQNSAIRSNNTSGTRGVFWFARDKRWHAFIGSNGKRLFLGSFDKKYDAVAARRSAEREHNYHQNHGRALQHSSRQGRVIHRIGG